MEMTSERATVIDRFVPDFTVEVGGGGRGKIPNVNVLIWIGITYQRLGEENEPKSKAEII